MAKDTIQLKGKRLGEGTCSTKVKDQETEYIKNIKRNPKGKMGRGYKKRHFAKEKPSA